MINGLQVGKEVLAEAHARFELRIEEPGENFVSEPAIVVKATCYARVI